MRKLIWFLTLVIFPVAGYPQQSHKSLSNDQTTEEIIKACTSGINDPKVTKKDQAWFAIRAGGISQFDKKDASTVVGFFLIAVEKGRLDGYAWIGDLYREGYGSIKIDYKRANDYYDLDTTYSSTKLRGLGIMYREGKGKDRNLEAAALHFMWALEKSEESFDAMTLCDIYADNANPLRNLIIAETYCRIAVKLMDHAGLKGNFEVRRIRIADQLTPTQQEQSRRQFERCVALKYSLMCHDLSELDRLPVPRSK